MDKPFPDLSPLLCRSGGDLFDDCNLLLEHIRELFLVISEVKELNPEQWTGVGALGADLCAVLLARLEAYHQQVEGRTQASADRGGPLH
jgi:hypothetical protein